MGFSDCYESFSSSFPVDLEGLILRLRIAPAPRVPKARSPRVEEGSGTELEAGAVGSCILSKAKTRRTDPEIFIESNVIPLNPKKSFDKESAFVAPDESTRLVPRKASKCRDLKIKTGIFNIFPVFIIFC